MQSAISVKAGAAFLAGVLVALGGAVIYFKASDSHLRPAAPATLVEPLASPAPPPDIPVPTPKLASTPPEITTPKPIAKPKAVYTKPRHAKRESLVVFHPKAEEPVPQEVAQNLPPPPPDLTPAAPEVVPLQPDASSVPVQRQPHTVTIPAGTSVVVRMMEKLSTDHNFSGDTFRATLDTPIVMDGFIIADRGAKVLGRITKAEKAGKFQGTSELRVALTEIATTDGQQLHVVTNESLRKGQSNTNEEVLKMGGGAALGAIIGAIAGGGKGAAIGAGAGGAAGTGAVLLGHGRPAVIDNETRLTFTLDQPTTLTEHLN
jgi:hypothetical protein